MNGAMVPVLWSEGKRETVLEYVAQYAAKRFVEAIPRTVVGRVQRVGLEDQEVAAEARHTADMSRS